MTYVLYAEFYKILLNLTNSILLEVKFKGNTSIQFQETRQHNKQKNKQKETKNKVKLRKIYDMNNNWEPAAGKFSVTSKNKTDLGFGSSLASVTLTKIKSLKRVKELLHVKLRNGSYRML